MFQVDPGRGKESGILGPFFGGMEIPISMGNFTILDSFLFRYIYMIYMCNFYSYKLQNP